MNKLIQRLSWWGWSQIPVQICSPPKPVPFLPPGVASLWRSKRQKNSSVSQGDSNQILPLGQVQCWPTPEGRHGLAGRGGDAVERQTPSWPGVCSRNPDQIQSDTPLLGADHSMLTTPACVAPQVLRKSGEGPHTHQPPIWAAPPLSISSFSRYF